MATVLEKISVEISVEIRFPAEKHSRLSCNQTIIMNWSVLKWTELKGYISLDDWMGCDKTPSMVIGECKVTSTETEKSADVTVHIALMVSPIVGVYSLWKYLIFANFNTSRRYHSKDKKKLLMTFAASKYVKTYSKQSKQSDNTLASSDDEQHFG
ncbi:unnamed protein product [Rhizophagus irregularis]|nr:unnamed protein product [Rhizophagus irregularis]